MAQEQIDLKKMHEELKSSKDELRQLKKDLEFSRRTEEAYTRIESGEYIDVRSENLEEEMKKW